MYRFSYVPFIDGLRAISILYVLAFHGLGPISHALTQASGWIGVNNFFVVSGFLITCLLLQEELDTGTFNLKSFYLRRLLRIAPAYYAYLLFFFLLNLKYGHHLNWPVTVAACYMADYDSAMGWKIAQPFGELSLTWSLAVEEKFYLLYPLLLKTFTRFRLRLAFCLLFLIEIWKVWLICAHSASWLRLCDAFDTRFDDILIGCIAGMIWSDPNCRQATLRFLGRRFVPVAASIVLLISMQTMVDPSVPTTCLEKLVFWVARIPVHAALVAVLLLSLMANRESLIAKILSCSPLVWIGRLSYSLYLWHILAFGWGVSFISQHIHFSASESLRLMTGLLLAAVSYYCVEKPFLRLKGLLVTKRAKDDVTVTPQDRGVPAMTTAQ